MQSWSQQNRSETIEETLLEYSNRRQRHSAAALR